MRKTLSYLVAATAFSFGAPAFAADSELVVFDWGGYEDEMFFQDYMKKYGDPPTYSFFSDGLSLNTIMGLYKLKKRLFE